MVWDIYSRDDITLANEIRIVSNDNYLQYNQPFRVDFDFVQHSIGDTCHLMKRFGFSVDISHGIYQPLV